MLRGLLLQNHGVAVHFLCSPQLDPEVLDPLAGMVTSLGGEFNTHVVTDARIDDLPTASYISKVTWYRILLPELVAHDRIIYLDCDTLVTDDLTPLWDLDLHGHCIAAVDGVPEPGGSQWRQELGIPDRVRPFNAGVLVLNLEAMREQQIIDRLLAFAHAHAAHARLTDQETLNAVMGEERLRLHPRWNCQNALFRTARNRALRVFSEREIVQAKEQPAVIHFEGPGDCKPWHFLSSHPWAFRYREELARTPWHDTPLRGSTLRNRLIAATVPDKWRIPVYAWIEHRKRRLGLSSDLEQRAA
jgi:lipopolysaccharide biosynthesis glycosyltransferase